MQKRFEYIMNAEEHGTVSNIVKTEKQDAEMMAEKILTEDVSKEEIINFLYSAAHNLSIASNILNCDN